MVSQREKIIGMILLTLGILWVGVFNSQNSRPQTAGKKVSQADKDFKLSPPAVKPAVKKDFKRMAEKVLIKVERKETEGDALDPFRKFDVRDLMDRAVLEFSELKLIGIVIDEETKAALINDEILYVGDEMSGFKVTDIRPNEVSLARGLEKYTLKLFVEP